MDVIRSGAAPLLTSEDVVRARQMVRAWMVELGFSLVDQTKMITAASELARNTVEYGGGGSVRLTAQKDGARTGLRLVFEDHGPGIPDIEMALKGGYSTGHGLGLGLSGSKRLVNEFELWSVPGQGTRVTVTRWR